MLDKSLDIIYNKKHIVILPQAYDNLLESFNYTFGNTILLTSNINDKKIIIDFINQNNFKNIIFVNYQLEYDQIISSIIQKIDYNFIFTENLAAFSNEYIYNIYKGVYKLYKNTPNSKLGIIDYSLFECLKNNNENVEHIILDIKRNTKSIDIKKNMIGLLNSEYNPNHSFYNELSAIKLLDNMKANLSYCSKRTKRFLKTFEINYNLEKNYSNVLKSSEINLYINFTDNNNLLFLESMDRGIPCILGNNEILDCNKYLKKMLVMKSDDDINEISKKIIDVKKNKEKIIKEYQKFRDAYTIESQKSVEIFLNEKLNHQENTRFNDVLITAIVPVYNTGKYLKKTLDSIISASVDNMEILIINDGSTDDSEKIILDYQKKYPRLIKYIYQENHGLGNVRNVGLKNAKGKYIASIDSDDTINKHFFSDALKYLNNDIDVVIYDWLTVTDNNNYLTAASDYIFNNPSFNRYERLLYTTIMPSTCNKIMKKSLFDDLKVKYNEDKYEDLSTNPFILLKAETIKYINKSYYEYYIRSDSIMRSSAGYSMINVLKLFDERIKKYTQYINVNLEKFKFYTYSWRIEEYILNQLYVLNNKEISEFIKYINNNLREVIIGIFKSNEYNKMLEKIKYEDREYINKRNKAFINNNLEKFIKKAKKGEKYFKLTAPIIYYGNK